MSDPEYKPCSCVFALESAAVKLTDKGRSFPELEISYFCGRCGHTYRNTGPRPGLFLLPSGALRGDAAMSSPNDRLLSDQAAERLHVEALAVLSAPMVYPIAEALAAAVVVLSRDRQARIEMARVLP